MSTSGEFQRAPSQALRSHGLPLLDMLQPGLTNEEIAETVAPTGLTLQEEAAALWRWRNGVSLDVDAEVS